MFLLVYKIEQTKQKTFHVTKASHTREPCGHRKDDYQITRHRITDSIRLSLEADSHKRGIAMSYSV